MSIRRVFACLRGGAILRGLLTICIAQCLAQSQTDPAVAPKFDVASVRLADTSMALGMHGGPVTVIPAVSPMIESAFQPCCNEPTESNRIKSLAPTLDFTEMEPATASTRRCLQTQQWNSLD